MITFVKDYVAMRRMEMDEIRQRNPNALPGVGYILFAIGAAATIGIPIITFQLIQNELWPLMIKEWPFPGVLDFIIIMSLGAVYFSAATLVAAAWLVDFGDRVRRFRRKQAAYDAIERAQEFKQGRPAPAEAEEASINLPDKPSGVTRLR